jgi:hypothetical protein
MNFCTNSKNQPSFLAIGEGFLPSYDPILNIPSESLFTNGSRLDWLFMAQGGKIKTY